MIREPTHRPVSRRQAASQKNPYEGRWRWWYSHIADWMIRNPGGRLEDCAAELNRSPQTVYYITASDTFKDYFARRKAEWTEQHDRAIRMKLTSVAESALDSLQEVVRKRGDQVPMQVITEVATSVLDRLGFSPKQSPQVAVQVNDNRSVVLPPAVTPAALEEAREALRRVEQRRLSEPTASLLPTETALEVRPLPLADEEAAREPPEVSDDPPTLDN